MSTQLNKPSLIQVAALTTGHNTPSTRFRVRQHINMLRQYDVSVTEYFPRIDKYMRIPFFLRGSRWEQNSLVDNLWRTIKLSARIPGYIASQTSHITWLQRELLPDHFTLERYLKPPLVFDFDDAIWLLSPQANKAIAAIVQQSSLVVAGNQYLADWAKQHNPNVRIVPTAIDIERFYPRETPKAENTGFIIGWTGTATNLPYLYDIEDSIHRFLMQHPLANLLIVCERRPEFTKISDARVRYLPWSPEIEASSIREMDVGLMPLPDNAWTRGKCSFKMLQYMSSGIPCIVSPVGLNADILKLGQIGTSAHCHDEWFNALSVYYNDHQLMQMHGHNGRHVAEKQFSREVISKELASLFHSLV